MTINFNITDTDPLFAAQQLDDATLNTTLTDVGHALCITLHEAPTITRKPTPDPIAVPPLQQYKDDPQVVWIRKSRDFYRWTIRYFQELTQEYHWRFGRYHPMSTMLEKYTSDAVFCLPVHETYFPTPLEDTIGRLVDLWRNTNNKWTNRELPAFYQ